MAGALGGVWAGGLAVPDERVAQPATRVVRAGTARIEVPQAWQTVRSHRDSPSCSRLHPRCVIASSSRWGRRTMRLSCPRACVRAPRTSDRDRARSSWPGTPPGGTEAWLGRRNDEALDVTVLPGRDTVLSVACVASVRDALAAPDCAAAITSVSLGGAPTLVPAPDLGLRQLLPAGPRRVGSHAHRGASRARRRRHRRAPRHGGHAGWRPRTSAPRTRCGPWRQTAARR